LQPDTLGAWWYVRLDGETGRILFSTGHLSNVVGLLLADRRAVVVKVRPSAKHLLACALVQRHLGLTAMHVRSSWLARAT
jgi:hypothetical protein